ncbi:hypothetical protein ACVWXU_000486 [Streptomyces sp. TE33382]
MADPDAPWLTDAMWRAADLTRTDWKVRQGFADGAGRGR